MCIRDSRVTDEAHFGGPHELKQAEREHSDGLGEPAGPAPCGSDESDESLGSV